MAVRQNLALKFEQDPLDALGRAQVAFQPIVSTTSLAAHGFEALTRLDGSSAFTSIHELLDAAERNGQLRLAERAMPRLPTGRCAIGKRAMKPPRPGRTARATLLFDACHSSDKDRSP